LDPWITNGYHERNPNCYDSFKAFLTKLGFTLYPTEFDCVSSLHPFVDIAAKMGQFFWAFEYKSQNDSISRGVEQLRCYLDWFDYVVLVSERSFDHRTSKNYWSLRKLGAGIWFYEPTSEKCIQAHNPRIQSPFGTNRFLVSKRFSALSRARHRLSRAHDSDRQTDLCAFVS
jgi:hypothetical protein